jgi:lathosterol oxidase
MGHTFEALSVWRVTLWGLGFFASIYLVFGSFTWFLTRHLLPSMGMGRTLDPRPPARGQLKRELQHSAISVLIFGVGMIFTWGLLQLGWAHLSPDSGGWRIPLEILALVIWNDIHFWINHRLLHTRLLRSFHLPHHRSIVTTPFATYSFHPIEALMLGNVILLPMLVHDFNFWSLFSVPLFSLFFNCVGHANYDFFPGVSPGHWFAGSRRHHLHHA